MTNLGQPGVGRITGSTSRFREDQGVIENKPTGRTDSGMEHFGYKESLARSIGAGCGGPAISEDCSAALA